MRAETSGVAEPIGQHGLAWLLACVAGMVVAGGGCVQEGAGSRGGEPEAAAVAAREFAIEGMNCEGCVEAVTAAVAKVPGVQRVQVSLEDKRARVVADPSVVPDSAIENAVVRAGYQARPATSRPDVPEGRPKP